MGADSLHPCVDLQVNRQAVGSCCDQRIEKVSRVHRRRQPKLDDARCGLHRLFAEQQDRNIDAGASQLDPLGDERNTQALFCRHNHIRIIFKKQFAN